MTSTIALLLVATTHQFPVYSDYYQIPHADLPPVYYRNLISPEFETPIQFSQEIPPRALPYEERLYQVFYNASDVQRRKPVIVNYMLRGQVVQHHWYLWHDDGVSVTVRTFDPTRREMIRIFDDRGQLYVREIYDLPMRLSRNECYDVDCNNGHPLDRQCSIGTSMHACAVSTPGYGTETPFYWWGR